MQFLSHFNSKDALQLINGIFSALQKLPKYFNGTTKPNFTLPDSFALQLGLAALTPPTTRVDATLGVLSNNLLLYLKALELTTLLLG